MFGISAIPAVWKFSAVAGLCLYAYHIGSEHAENRVRAEWAQSNNLAELVRNEAISAAVEAIRGIQVERVEVTRNVYQKTKEVPVYRECRHDSSVYDDIKRAATGAIPATAGVLPQASGASR